MTTANHGGSRISRALLKWHQRIPQPLRYLGLLEAYLIIWAILDQVALLFATAPETFVWYPPVGLDVTLLFVFGLRYVPALFLNTFVHEYLITNSDLDLTSLLIFGLISTVGYGGVSALLLRKIKINPRLRTLRDVMWFVVVMTLFTPLIVAALQTFIIVLQRIIPLSTWLVYTLHSWAGAATGIAMLAPFLLVLLRQLPWVWAYKEQEVPASEPPLIPLAAKQRPELILEIAALCVAIWAAYGAQRGESLNYSYFVFLPLIWIAIQHGFERATAAVLFINIGVAIFVQAKLGGSNVFALQFGMMAISLTGILLGGFATQRMQAETELNYSAQRLRILHELDQAILATRSLSEIAAAAVTQVAQMIPCTRISLVMFDFEKSEVTLLAIHTERETQVPGIRLPLSAFGDVEPLQRGEVNVIQETRTTQMPAGAELLLGNQVRAYINIPLIAQGELIGSLNISKDTLGAFPNQLRTVAEQVASTVAIAIQQARLFEQIERQALHERSLNQISRILNSSLDPQAVLCQIVQLTGECFAVDRVVIFNFTQRQIQVLNEWRSHAEVVSMQDFIAPIADWPDLLDPDSDFFCHHFFHAPDYAQTPMTPARLQQIEHAKTLSVLSVPIFVRDQLFGGLSLQTTTTYRTFTAEEISLLQRISEQAAIALYNARSYESLEEIVQQRTQELEQEKQLSEAANRAKTEFLSNISHELRTPLTGILGFSSVLLEQVFGTLNSKQMQYLELISTAGKHLLELINDLLDLTKIEAAKEELQLEQVIIAEIANACISMLQERAQEQGLKLELQIAPNVTDCIADKRRLKQILVNLLTNAIKFTETGSVTLNIIQTPSETQFSVIDTGIGISQEDLAKLFQPFQQLDSGLDRKYEGTGLGLALSRKLAQLHNGDLTVESELGRGSRFTLHLPLRVGNC
ncbi:multi-sensor signal transduction histidine kinase [Gloeocapsa sp. PCC 7428]|uniref:ATP-binding protein n=1 Tax=Gloeocapsa sp. PCC 7428 TaxID=1173026 RepID=UPI0002A5DFDC|nr:ATP-binding protein [Gloeocapsa sp. PCC 7428]AFZ32578.1 multi-sensor signal transduction histidine kinase [Gloeocapsa sp. PCC 7428]